MHIITQLYRISHMYTVLNEKFDNNKRKWQVGAGEPEADLIINNGLWINNTSQSISKSFQIRTSLRSTDDFIIDTTLELLENTIPGHFGFTWGNKKTSDLINRFTLSSDGERSLIRHLDGDAPQAAFRSQNKLRGLWRNNNKIRLSIIRMKSFYYFMIDKNVVDVVNEGHFLMRGPYLGFIADPTIRLRCEFLELKKLRCLKQETVAGLSLLLN